MVVCSAKRKPFWGINPDLIQKVLFSIYWFFGLVVTKVLVWKKYSNKPLIQKVLFSIDPCLEKVLEQSFSTESTILYILFFWPSSYKSPRLVQKFQPRRFGKFFSNFFSFAPITNPLAVFLDGLKQLDCEILSTKWFDHKQRKAEMFGLPYVNYTTMFLKSRLKSQKQT